MVSDDEILAFLKRDPSNVMDVADLINPTAYGELCMRDDLTHDQFLIACGDIVIQAFANKLAQEIDDGPSQPS